MNWGPGAAAGFQNALARGMQFGSMVRQREQENALMQQRERQIALAEQKAQAEAQRGQIEQRRADLPMLTRLLEHASQGEQQWQESISLAQQYGIDTSRIPQQFDPEWAASQAQTMKLLASPQGQEALSTAGKQATDEGLQPGTPEFQSRVTELVNAGLVATQVAQPGGTIIAHDKRTGDTRTIVQGQNFGNGPQASVPTAVNPQTGERLVLRNGQWVPEGGASSNASGGFPPGQ